NNFSDCFWKYCV
uniref:Urotensin-2 n=2 Tax=Galeoidea TaxID=119195 RepID=UTS2_SCYCA|nr:RecName: Full=Urotensin-2; AltName: Full=Urotensin II; Short=U-II; Short=UII [Scyliorhinus canicula]AAB47076.1 urotensin II, UII [Lampetra fluviatilis=river lampreys, brain, Peptide, 12 aa] [Lampetra fluviatilis]AAB47077.1 urotensin II, UII [Petromyzon marinus=sea lampreys, brain, Peptide, 12 aa] [Petromyzon marinus]prf//2003277B urotensin II [Beringraja rhina]